MKKHCKHTKNLDAKDKVIKDTQDELKKLVKEKFRKKLDAIGSEGSKLTFEESKQRNGDLP